jgi:hypothetical protein
LKTTRASVRFRQRITSRRGPALEIEVRGRIEP